MSCDVGLYGLAVMGQNFALNMASHGFKVCVGNRSPSKVELAVDRAREEGDLPLVGSVDVEDFVRQLSKPRKVFILVQAGKAVDDTISLLTQHMEAGDVIVDGGNEWFHNTLRRSRELESRGLHFVGMGISGGEEGARNGPSLMPGGSRVAYDIIEPVLSKCAATVVDGPCSGYVGPAGSGNYVKMVHNGIEYGDMQLIGEVYDVMRTVLGLSNDEMAGIFDEWNGTELESYLIEITSKILGKADDLTGEGHVVDYVLDKTGECFCSIFVLLRDGAHAFPSRYYCARCPGSVPSPPAVSARILYSSCTSHPNIHIPSIHHIYIVHVIIIKIIIAS